MLGWRHCVSVHVGRHSTHPAHSDDHGEFALMATQTASPTIGCLLSDSTQSTNQMTVIQSCAKKMPACLNISNSKSRFWSRDDCEVCMHSDHQSIVGYLGFFASLANGCLHSLLCTFAMVSVSEWLSKFCRPYGVNKG